MLYCRLLSFIFIFLGSMTCAQSEEKSLNTESSPLIPRKLLFGNPEKTSAKLSPNGSKLAYLAPDKNMY